MKYVITALSRPPAPGVTDPNPPMLLVALFSNTLTHRGVYTGARAGLWTDYPGCETKVHSAGFVTIAPRDDGTLRVTAYGRSESLLADSKPGDDERILAFLRP